MVTEKFKSKGKAPKENPLTSEGLYPNPESLYAQDSINLGILNRLVGQSILSVDQFDKELVLEICKFAALLESTEIASSHPLDGKIIITAFFEASTRTRLSFESAVLRLDGKIISIPTGKVTGVAKGESLSDIGEMFNAYGDLVVVRHTQTDSLDEIMQNLRLPLINAGNGSGEHPTQALADWFAILKWKPKLKMDNIRDDDKIHLGILGTPGSMRAVNSFLRMSLLFKSGIRKISIISELADPLGPELETMLQESTMEFTITNDINDVLSDLDVVYMNSIAFLGDSYKTLDSRFKLNAQSNLKDDAVVLHPLARLDELDPNLDGTNHNLYFTQAHGAVFVRQALFISILNRFDRLPSKSIPLKT
ncbi:aspartate/ornithine carbamoyltransferase family protein [Flavilitoribacter nigricans]|uniref:Aspartate carbamoyltransferase n=1 Tax=Flavilitoribacter nigricans (strain ATCC 23147 / DSM 23189 / NBRC 102662 / NCIMB 1420 / SS-2) TaxID=1122177 RepID=A0A2D0NCS7_FLAN2|nr:aspartate carbamoyltransferase [Flavilitoribacter nigricans]PHN06314.1 aspartate carbamoyltransferase [Flavilitoribacter nigricans DSM 23189 = NBRC 102662]